MGLAYLGAASATAIGGALAYLGSWRLVYLVYGVGELILALIMLKHLPHDLPVTKRFHLLASYRVPLSNFRFMRLIVLLFLIGFGVLGAFSFSGVYLQEKSEWNTLLVGLLLASFGIGTVIGGRGSVILRKKLGRGFLVAAALTGFASFYLLIAPMPIAVNVLGFLGLGAAFMAVQSTIITTAQGILTSMKGTAMSVAAFNMFLGGALGTFINGALIKEYAVRQIFYHSSYMFLTAALLAAVFVALFEREGK